MAIHRYLFKDVFAHAGEFRTYNISKNELVLNGKSVFYASCDGIPMTLDYDFNTEKKFSYGKLSNKEIIRHLAKFTCDICQIRPIMLFYVILADMLDGVKDNDGVPYITADGKLNTNYELNTEEDSGI